MNERPRITMVCTGNAARSVMAAALLRDRLGEHSPVEVASAGTLVLPDQPMSSRTRAALARHNLSHPDHRSRQLDLAEVRRSSLLLTMEPSHHQWMRRRLPEALPIAGSLRRVVRDLANYDGDLDQRVAALGLADHVMEPWEEIIDPGAGQQEAFDRCIDELAALIDDLAQQLRIVTQ
jgi:protein-tyrosine-phosphatase